MTNYEHIKAMSVEEMAEFLCGDCVHCAFWGEACYRYTQMSCDEGVYKWLNSEVEE